MNANVKFSQKPLISKLIIFSNTNNTTYDLIILFTNIYFLDLKIDFESPDSTRSWLVFEPMRMFVKKLSPDFLDIGRFVFSMTACPLNEASMLRDRSCKSLEKSLEIYS